MSRASLQRRLFLGALAWIVLALIATGVLLSVLFRDHLEDELARRLDADFLQLVSQLETAADGSLTHPRAMSDPLYQRVLSGYYWEVDRDDTVLMRSRSLWDQALAPDPDGGPLQRIEGPRGMPLLAAVRRVTLPRTDAPLRLTVAASLSPVEAAVADFRRTIAMALGVLALGLIGAAALQVRLGLQPLARLRRELGAIRGARADRLSDDYPSEVSPLVADLNNVLAHNASLIERARRQAGNLAHALKTPLSVVGNEAARMQRHGEAERAQRLQHEVDAMQRQIDWHLARTRIAGGRRGGQATVVAPVLERLQRTLQRLYGERGVVIDTDGGWSAMASMRYCCSERLSKPKLSTSLTGLCIVRVSVQWMVIISGCSSSVVMLASVVSSNPGKSDCGSCTVTGLFNSICMFTVEPLSTRAERNVAI